jgi:hypothetical protein
MGNCRATKRTRYPTAQIAAAPLEELRGVGVRGAGEFNLSADGSKQEELNLDADSLSANRNGHLHHFGRIKGLLIKFSGCSHPLGGCYITSSGIFPVFVAVSPLTWGFGSQRLHRRRWEHFFRVTL